MPHLNHHPLSLWQSETVTNLLHDFIVANYTKAGVLPKFAEEFVLKPWREKGTKDWEELRQECGELLLDIKAEVNGNITEKETLGLIDISGVKTLLDLGANRLAAINYFSRYNPEIKKFIAVDVIPQNGEFLLPEKSEYYQLSTQAEKLPVEPSSVDVVLVRYTFHHFPSEAAIIKSISMCHQVLRPDGRLILLEESFTEAFDSKKAKTNREVFGIETDEDLTHRFYRLSENERFEFIVANDWLINVHNPHMQWTGQYRSWGEWVKLLRQTGFEISKYYNLGLRLNGRLKQGLHMVGEFTVV